jgi:hypothetical protein
VQGEILLSEDSLQGGEAAQTHGCLSVFLFPPFSALLFGTLLFLGLIQIRLGVPVRQSSKLAQLFTPQVLYWETEILKWSDEVGLDPNLVATVMQIESCGDPQALSHAGAMGLFQVMPFHFSDGEDSFDATTNAGRGLTYLRRSLETFDDNASMAMAGYNAGIGGASQPQSEWPQETIDYVYWGTNIYADATAGEERSAVLDEWLAAGGASLCAQAELRVAAVP